MLPKWQRTYVVVSAYVATWAVIYVAVHYGGWPRLVHFQREGEFRFATPPWGAEPSDYLGINAWAAGASLVVAGVTALVVSRKKRAFSDRALFVIGSWAVGAMVYAGSYYAWHNWP